MKLIYCTHSVCNPGGMERVLLNKVTYLSKLPGWEIAIVTTDQHHRPPFYPFPKNVRMTDLDINYSDDNDKGAWIKITGYLRKRRAHKRKLTALLQKEKADIVVSLYPSESSFIPDIKDGSKKVLELHYCKFFRLQYGRKGLLGLIDKWRTHQDERIVRRFDKFVVLTHEDRGYWGDWDIVQRDAAFHDWQLDIFGQGEWREMLQRMIDERGLQDSLHLNQPTRQIGDEYVHSSLLVMSSHYEGFPMVMIEAMACGLPVVSFDFKCGPKDIIRDGENGLTVADGDIEGLAAAMMKIMSDNRYRTTLSANARKVVATYSEQAVMAQWLHLFTSLTRQ